MSAKASGYHIPSKPIYALSWIASIAMFAWFATHDKWIAEISGVLVAVHALSMIVKPQMQPRATFLFPEGVGDQFFYWMQRAGGVLFVVFAIFIFANYRITESKQFGIGALVFFGVIFISTVLWFILLGRKTSHDARVLMFGISVLCGFSAIGGIFMIKHNAPLHTSPTLWLPGTIIGVVVGHLLILKWSKKLR